LPLGEIDNLAEDSQEVITSTNIAFIKEVRANRKMKDALKKVEDDLSRSREENKELKDQLQLLQAANKKLS
jgi:septation ring formation regulator EzrA